MPMARTPIPRIDLIELIEDCDFERVILILERVVEGIDLIELIEDCDLYTLCKGQWLR